jgi:hypothetical protein
MKELTPDQIKLIKQPLPKDAVKDHPTKKGMSTIKAIYVTERLNDVFGIGKWRIETTLLPIKADGSLFAVNTYTTSNNRERTEYFAVSKTILSIPEYDIYYECIAGASNDDMGDAAKGSATDAITKICSYIGIGIDVFKGQQDQAVRNYDRQRAEVEATKAQPVPEVQWDMAKTLAKILECKTVAELSSLRDSLPTSVQNDEQFKKAALLRYNAIK